MTLTAAGQASPLTAMQNVPLLHWHGDTFDLPEGTTLLASTRSYPNQAFARGPNILALQFHPEMGEDDGFTIWCDKGDPFIAAAGTSVDQLITEHTQFGPAAVAAEQVMLDSWLAQLER